MNRHALAVGLIAIGAIATSNLFAHEDDPKGSERHRPVFGPAWREADGGVAMETFASSGVALKSWFPVNNFDTGGVTNTSANDCWGYVTPLGKEIAIVGLSGGTGFVDVTNPSAASIVGFIPGPTSLWRNVKVYQHWCYAVSEGGGGIQVIELADIDNGNVTLVNNVGTGGDVKTHTMIINTQTGFLYRMGGGSNGIRVYDLKPNPVNPLFVAQWQSKYTHDGFVTSYDSGPYAGKEIFLACGGLNNGYVNTGIDIIDVTDKSNIVTLSSLQYPNAGFCHQAWFSQDKKHIYINDELDEANLGIYSLGRIVNIENLSAPSLVGTYTTNLISVDHNLYVRDNRMYCSNYKTGIQIFDVSDELNPQKIAWFDTYPESDGGGYAGLWSNYPFFPSGTVIGSDIERGLFVWRVESPVADFAYPQGQPSFIDPSGGATLDIQITPRAGQTLAAGSAQLLVTVGAGSPVQYPLSPLGNDLYRATFPALDCGTQFKYSFSVTGDDGIVTSDPPGGIAAIGALGEPIAMSESFESGTNGWIGGLPGDTATSGQWVLVDPIGTSAQPENDHTPDPGSKCWVTGQGPVGGGVGAADVDGGITSLVSAVYDVSALTDPIISYWRWYSNNQGSNPGTDAMPVYISNNGGASWVPLETVTENAGAWVKKSFHIADYVTPTSQIRLKFVASDEGTGAIVEAGVDDVAISSYDCPTNLPGDLNSDGSVNTADLGVLLGQWGPVQAGSGASADLNDDGVVNAADLAILLGFWH
ncbi:MAG: choice-of-anchor B family protein [Phycisphaerales bacterium]